MWNALIGIRGCLNLFVHGWYGLTSSINLQMSIFMFSIKSIKRNRSKMQLHPSQQVYVVGVVSTRLRR
jgi:hypothetical protein